MATLLPNSLITLSQRRRTCVLDPSLFLSHYGLLVVKSLGEVLELWIARELWHMLDNPSFYLTQSAWNTPQLEWERSPESQPIAQQKRSQALRHWELLRSQTPPTDLHLFWIGDRPTESFLPPNTDPHLIQHWETLAQSLEHRTQNPSTTSPILTAALRDTAALAAIVEPAFILCHQPPNTPANTPPEICQILEQWQIPCQQIDPMDTITTQEREQLLQIIIAAGLAKLLWSGLNLIVLHLFVPHAFMINYKTQSSSANLYCSPEEKSAAHLWDYWEGTQGFWYKL
jgi:hypothetical protein